MKRCRPSPLREYAHSATTRSSLSAWSPSSAIRLPSNALTLTGSPFRTISRTAGAVSSMKLAASGVAHWNRTVLVDRKVSSPPVRSSST